MATLEPLFVICQLEPDPTALPHITRHRVLRLALASRPVC